MSWEITQNTRRNQKGVVYVHFHTRDLGITCLSLNQTNWELVGNIVGCVWEHIGNKKIQYPHPSFPLKWKNPLGAQGKPSWWEEEAYDDILVNFQHTSANWKCQQILFVGLALQGKEIVFRFIIEYSSLRDFGPLGNNNNNNNRSIFKWGFLKDDVLACVETWETSYYRVIIISWRILVSFWGFFGRLYFGMVKYLSFHNSSFALRYFWM